MTHEQREHIPDDFREVVAGMKGEMPWKPAITDGFSGWIAPVSGVWCPIESPDTVPDWEAVENGFLCESRKEWGDGSCIAFGDASWEYVELTALVTALGGGNVQMFFCFNEQTGAGYVFDMLYGWQAIQIARFQVALGEFERLSVVNYPLEHGREYAVTIAARGASLTTYVDGALVNQVTDATLKRGRVALNGWHSRTLYRDPRYRLLA